MNSSLNLHCPACGAVIVPRLGCCGSCLTRALQLQAARFGTELSCRECGRQHVVQQTDASRREVAHVTAVGSRFADEDWQVGSLAEPDEPPGAAGS